MSKHAKGKRRKPGNTGTRREDSRFSSLNISTVDQHKRVGSKLLPPLAQIPNMTTSSWADHHLPEMLWAALPVCPKGQHVGAGRGPGKVLGENASRYCCGSCRAMKFNRSLTD